MSPFVHSPISKHDRRLLTLPHVRYVEEVQSFHRRTNTFQSSQQSFNDVINRWWLAFAIGGLILIMLLVVTGVGLVRCVRRRKSRPLAPESDINEKENGSGKATAPSVDSILFPLPPQIMVTPATAPPTKLRFSLETDETLTDLADYGDKFTGPELRPDLHELEHQKSSDSPIERDLDGSKTDIAHVQASQHSLVHQLPRYHSEDPSNIPHRDKEDEALDEIDLHSPGASARRTGLPGTDTPVEQLAGRITITMPAKISAQNPSMGQVNIDLSPTAVSGSGSSGPELTEAELSTLMLQFPPPYSKTSRPMHRSGEKILPPRPETEPHDDRYTRHAVRHFAFHRPTGWQNRPDSPRSAANLHTASSRIISEPRSGHSSINSRAHSWTQDRAPMNTRSGPVSDRYATRHLAMETATAVRWSNLQREEKGRNEEEEMKDIA